MFSHLSNVSLIFSMEGVRTPLVVPDPSCNGEKTKGRKRQKPFLSISVSVTHSILLFFSCQRTSFGLVLYDYTSIHITIKMAVVGNLSGNLPFLLLQIIMIFVNRVNFINASGAKQVSISCINFFDINVSKA